MGLVVIASLLAAHLLAMNVASAAPALAVWMDWRNARGCAAAGTMGRPLHAAALVMLLVGSLLGLVVGWLLWSPEYSAAITRLWNKVFFGILELLFSAVLLGVNLVLWRSDGVATKRRRIGRSICSLLSASNLLYHFPVLLLVLWQLMQAGEFNGEPINSSEFRSLMMSPRVIARSAHFWLASFAVSGMLLAMIDLRRDATVAAKTAPAILGGRVALIASLLQIPVGIWVLTSSSATMSVRMLGADPIATLGFAASVLLSLSLMHRLANISFGDLNPRAMRTTALIMATIVLTMCVASRFAGR